MNTIDVLQKRIDEAERMHCKRSLLLRNGIDLSSNDYLGFSSDPELHQLFIENLKTLAVGSTGSRLLRGHSEVFESAEKVLSEFCGKDAALIFPSGYQANVGLLSGLLRKGDHVFSDELNHASIIDGIQLSKATKWIYPHKDLKTLRNLLAECVNKKTGNGSEGDRDPFYLIVTESIFSMDGDCAPLKEIVELADEFGAHVVVDEAHATGLFGDFEKQQGGGMAQKLGLTSRILATVHPGGKAMGAGGAWIAGDLLMRQSLIQFARPFIFSTAPIPALPILLECSVLHWKEVGRLRAQKVLAYTERLNKSLQELNTAHIQVPQVEGTIIPILLGTNFRALMVSQSLQEAGFDIRAIRPPTVREGTARLRLTTHWAQVLDELDQSSKIAPQLAIQLASEINKSLERE